MSSSNSWERSAAGFDDTELIRRELRQLNDRIDYLYIFLILAMSFTAAGAVLFFAAIL